MVSFSCEVCNEILIKKKLMSHFGRCRQAYFTCIDCNTTFSGREFEKHTQCITEDQKYQGALYKAKPAKRAINAEQKPAEKPEAVSEPSAKKAKVEKTNKPAKGTLVSLKKEQSLKRALKQLRKDQKLSKKELFKSLTVSSTGQLTWA